MQGAQYFTVGHPPVFHTTSPTLLGLGWGVIATWWVGAMLGVPLAVVARAGSRPRLAWRDLVRPMGVLMVGAGCASLLAGIIGFWAAKTGVLVMGGSLASVVPAGKHARYLADACAHFAAYGTGFVGGVSVCAWAWWRRASWERGRPARMSG